jgi:hypothetical protein
MFYIIGPPKHESIVACPKLEPKMASDRSAFTMKTFKTNVAFWRQTLAVFAGKSVLIFLLLYCPSGVA